MTGLRLPDTARLLAVFVTVAAVICAMPASLAAAPARSDMATQDTPSFVRLPHFDITDTRDTVFEAFDFYDGKGCITVEGKKYRRAYTLRDGAPAASDSQIIRSYATALENMGGIVLFDGECAGIECAENCGHRMLVGKVMRTENELWVEVVPWGEGSQYLLTLVTKATLPQELTAGSLYTTLQRQGRVVLYIQFDAGTATIRADAQPLLDQIAKMLAANPELHLSVEGHTDSLRTRASARTLSVRQAVAVRSALVARGIDATRLAAVGWGQERPVADNRTEVGRAKNRRIELVEK